MLVCCLIAVSRLRVLLVYDPMQRDKFREEYEARHTAMQTSSGRGAASSEGAWQAPQQLQVFVFGSFNTMHHTKPCGGDKNSVMCG